MKKLTLLLLSVFCILFCGYAQDDQDSARKKRPQYSVNIRETNGNRIKGYLYKATEDSIYMNFPNQPSTHFYRLTPEQVNRITLRKKGTMGKSIMISAGVGLVGGLLIGFIEGDDSDNDLFYMSAGEKALGYGLLLGGTGAVVGTIIGATAKKTFIIGGKKEQYRINLEDITARAMTR